MSKQDPKDAPDKTNDTTGIDPLQASQKVDKLEETLPYQRVPALADTEEVKRPEELVDAFAPPTEESAKPALQDEAATEEAPRPTLPDQTARDLTAADTPAVHPHDTPAAPDATIAGTPAAEPSTEANKEKASKGGGMRAVGIVGGATVLSRILGLAREMVFVALFSRMATDAFAVAFTIPNLLRRLLAEGILSTAFIPVFSSVEEQDEETRQRTYGAVLGLFSVVLIVVTILGIFLSPWIVKPFAPGFSGQKLALTIFLTRLMFPYLFLVGLASFWIAILHTRKSFAAPALGPVLLNIGMIGSAVSLYSFLPPSKSVAALAIGVLIGGILQLVLQIVALARKQLKIKARWEPSHPAIREIGMLMMPTLFGLGVYQLNVLVSRALASLLPQGSITYIYISDRVMELPLGVIAVAFATVNLPTLAQQAEGEQWDAFRDTLINGVRNVLYFCVPAGIGLFVLREPVIMTLFQRGRFTAQDVANCAHIFIPAAFGLIFVAVLRNLTPGFYAYKDTRTPVKIAALSLILNVAFSGLFAFWLGMEGQGLTLANACSAVFSVLLAIVLLHKRLEFSNEHMTFIWQYTPRLLVSAGLMGMALWLPNKYIPWQSLNVIFKAGCIGVLTAVGAAVYFFLTWHLNLPEARAFLGRFGRIAGRLRSQK